MAMATIAKANNCESRQRQRRILGAWRAALERGRRLAGRWGGGRRGGLSGRRGVKAGDGDGEKVGHVDWKLDAADLARGAVEDARAKEVVAAGKVKLLEKSEGGRKKLLVAIVVEPDGNGLGEHGDLFAFGVEGGKGKVDRTMVDEVVAGDEGEL